MVMPAPIAPSTTQATMSDGVAMPLTHTAHSASALSIITTWEQRSTVRRE